MSDHYILNSFLATGIISFVPNVLLFFIPVTLLRNRSRFFDLQNIMFSFAAGGLLGDVFLHILPHILVSR